MNVRMRTIGHAGLDGEYPPNSLAGIRAAARSMDMVEVDVRRCASGEAILFHDAEMMPVTGREGRVSETGWPTMRTQTIHDSDETIIRLADAIGAVSPTVGLNLELKEIGIHSAISSLLDGIDHRVLISSFLPESPAVADRAEGLRRLQL